MRMAANGARWCWPPFRPKPMRCCRIPRSIPSGGDRRPSALLSRRDRRQEGDRGDDRHRSGERRRDAPRPRSAASPASRDCHWGGGVFGRRRWRGRTRIADVAVPARWTLDDGGTFRPVDPGMLAAAREALCRHWKAWLRQDRSQAGRSKRRPELVVGGDGCSWDNNNGAGVPVHPERRRRLRLPAPQRARSVTPVHRQLLGRRTGRWLRSALISNLNIARRRRPGLRGDGHRDRGRAGRGRRARCPVPRHPGHYGRAGDPLHLPGFPFQFFCYKRIAARTPPGSPPPSWELGRGLNGWSEPSGHRAGSDPNTTPTTTRETALRRRPIAASAAIVTLAVTPEPQ